MPGTVQRAERSERHAQDAGPTRPIPLSPRGDGPIPIVFHRGAHAPYATRWFGVTSLAGHARNFASAAIAAESIDARDWMRPDTAPELLAHIVAVLGGDATKPTLLDALGRPLWIDFVADTGDDHDVSRAVAEMLFAEYSVGGGAAPPPRVLPRGDVLLFGGDTAYPVATGEEIARRLVAPYNDVLRDRTHPDDPPRVVLGIAGNHDWYDGLDGFGRLFRRSPHETRAPDTPPLPRRRRVKRPAGIVARQLHLDEVSGLMKLVSNASASLHALWVGTKIARPRRLVLTGYEAVQDSSYWALPLAPQLEAWGVDRQLGYLDYRQRQFFGERHAKAIQGRLLFVAPDPAIAFGEHHSPGARMLSACKLSLERQRIFYLTGDLHHYERRDIARAPGKGGPKTPDLKASDPKSDNESVHVIAGGGGAFLHGTRIGPYPGAPPARVWPSGPASRKLLAQVPIKLIVGIAGFILHIALAMLGAIELAASARGTVVSTVATCAVSIGVATVLYTNVGHNRAHPRRVLALAIPFGAALGLLPMALQMALQMALPKIVPTLTGELGVVLVYAFVGAFLLGVFLAAAAVLGIEQQQAFSVLSHPGFKHFVRMCIHPDGRIEAWVVGKDDPLGPAPPVLVDHFEW